MENPELHINFIIGGDINQTIEITNGEEPLEFFEKLKNGTYLTSLFGGKVHEVTADGIKEVGEVKWSEVGDSTEFSDFDLFNESDFNS